MLLTRREMLASCAAAMAAPKYEPHIAAQFYVWTQQFGREKKPLAEGIPEALAATKRAGFRRVELVSWIFTPELRDITLRALREHGLALPIVYNGGPMHEAERAEQTIRKTVELAELVKPAGTRIINLNPDPKPRRERKSDDELRVQADKVSRLDAELRRRGMELILHHHDPEMAENAREWRRLLRNTNVRLCIDTHWVYRGGQDPLAILREAGARAASLHLRNSRGGVWTEEFGEGDLDYSRAAAHLKGIGFAGELVIELAYEKETKLTRTLEENLRASREYAERVFGVRA